MRMSIFCSGLFLCVLLGACAAPVKRYAPASGLLEVEGLDSLLQLDRSLITIIDVRPATDFRLGHIPGAVNIWRPALADEHFSYSSITAPRHKLEAEFGRLGIRADRPVVVYDGQMNADAANLWWIFQLAGKADVQLLAGGLKAWEAARLPLETDTLALAATVFQFPGKGDSSHYASLSSVLLALNDPDVVLLDTRTEDEYTGLKVKAGAKKGGHIPGSILLNYTDATCERDGCTQLKSIATLQAMFADKGITKDKKIICYCHSGVRSAHTTFVLSALLGYPSVRNYDGSWEEWSQSDSLPFVTGNQPLMPIFP